MFGEEKISAKEIRSIIDSRVLYHIEEINKWYEDNTASLFIRAKVCNDHRTQAKEIVNFAYALGVITFFQLHNITLTLDYMIQSKPMTDRGYVEVEKNAH